MSVSMYAHKRHKGHCSIVFTAAVDMSSSCYYCMYVCNTVCTDVGQLISLFVYICSLVCLYVYVFVYRDAFFVDLIFVCTFSLFLWIHSNKLYCIPQY